MSDTKIERLEVDYDSYNRKDLYSHQDKLNEVIDAVNKQEKLFLMYGDLINELGLKNQLDTCSDCGGSGSNIVEIMTDMGGSRGSKICPTCHSTGKKPLVVTVTTTGNKDDLPFTLGDSISAENDIDLSGVTNQALIRAQIAEEKLNDPNTITIPRCCWVCESLDCSLQCVDDGDMWQCKQNAVVYGTEDADGTIYTFSCDDFQLKKELL